MLPESFISQTSWRASESRALKFTSPPKDVTAINVMVEQMFFVAVDKLDVVGKNTKKKGFCSLVDNKSHPSTQTLLLEFFPFRLCSNCCQSHQSPISAFALSIHNLQLFIFSSSSRNKLPEFMKLK